MLKYIETDCLAQRAALADRHNVALLHLREGGRTVRCQVLVALLETAVLGDPVQVVPSDDDGAVHFRGKDDALENTATDGDGSRKGALLVDVGPGLRLLRGLEAQAHLPGPSRTLRSMGGCDSVLVNTSENRDKHMSSPTDTS